MVNGKACPGIFFLMFSGVGQKFGPHSQWNLGEFFCANFPNRKAPGPLPKIAKIKISDVYNMIFIKPTVNVLKIGQLVASKKA